MKIEDLHWLAGYLEGEGTFYAAGTKKPDGMYPTSVDLDVITLAIQEKEWLLYFNVHQIQLKTIHMPRVLWEQDNNNIE